MAPLVRTTSKTPGRVLVNILITSVGSAGDLYPMIGIGTALHHRGHDVLLVANPYFEPLLARLPLEVAPLGTAAEFTQLCANPNIWRPLQGPRLILKHAVITAMREIFHLIEQRYQPGKTVVISHSLDLGSRLAQEKLGVPQVTVHLSPALFRSLHHGPHFPPAVLGQGVPKWLKRLQWYLADRLVLDPIIREPVGAFREELGLPPVDRFFDRWWLSPQRVVGMFPDWFGRRQPDWPSQTQLTDFPLWDGGDVSPPTTQVRDYLATGEPPIVFTPGSAMQHGKAFFEVAARVGKLLGRRVLLLTRHTRHLPANLPLGVQHLAYEPLGYVLPRAAAVVHHGGIGTLSEGLLAGIPQLVMPMAYDQPDNAARLVSIGVGLAIKPRSFRTRTVTHALERLLTSSRVQQRCQEYAARLDRQTGLKKTCDLIEKFGDSVNVKRG